MRDLSTFTSIYGKTAVTLTRWRNRNATAFASVTIADAWHSCRWSFDAKSQGPSAGGFCKPTQALENLSREMRILSVLESMDRFACQRPETWAQLVAQIAESARVTGTIPVWAES